jgi:hypothetical protein
VLYDDPPAFMPGFANPIYQRLSMGDLVKRRSNARTFSTSNEANVFEFDLRQKVIPLHKDVLEEPGRYAARLGSRRASRWQDSLLRPPALG